jgi:hypothetical protein
VCLSYPISFALLPETTGSSSAESSGLGISGNFAFKYTVLAIAKHPPRPRQPAAKGSRAVVAVSTLISIDSIHIRPSKQIIPHADQDLGEEMRLRLCAEPKAFRVQQSANCQKTKRSMRVNILNTLTPDTSCITSNLLEQKLRAKTDVMAWTNRQSNPSNEHIRHERGDGCTAYEDVCKRFLETTGILSRAGC